jgi:hypothetical protein
VERESIAARERERERETLQVDKNRRDLAGLFFFAEHKTQSLERDIERERDTHIPPVTVEQPNSTRLMDDHLIPIKPSLHLASVLHLRLARHLRVRTKDRSDQRIHLRTRFDS